MPRSPGATSLVIALPHGAVFVPNLSHVGFLRVTIRGPGDCPREGSVNVRFTTYNTLGHEDSSPATAQRTSFDVYAWDLDRLVATLAAAVETAKRDGIFPPPEALPKALASKFAATSEAVRSPSAT